MLKQHSCQTGDLLPIAGMSFILLEFDRHAAAPTNPTGQHLSEPPENRLDGHPKYRTVCGGSLQTR
jgi:hypothetical protein